MGLVQKKDERDLVDGIEAIGRGQGPDGLEEFQVELHEGATAEDISGATAAREGALELEADPELLAVEDDAADSADADWDLDLDAGVDADTDIDEADEADAEVGASRVAPAGSKVGRHAVGYIVVGLIAVIVAAIGGYFVGSGGFGSKGAPAALLTEEQLDNVVASWSYKGASHDISAREAIEAQYSLDAVKTEDGTYPVPPADSILGVVRNRVLVDEAKAQGIEVADDELATEAENMLGISDFDEIARQYGVSAEQAKEIVRDQSLIKRLQATVVKDAPVMPDAPSEPADGDVTASAPEYAAYIIDLAGDDWDAETGTWSNPDSPYAQVFVDAEFTGETATYEQAQAAYFVAYQAYAEESSGGTEEWTTYVNGLFADVDLNLYGLYA